jgi:hypothetical protein
MIHPDLLAPKSPVAEPAHADPMSAISRLRRIAARLATEDDADAGWFVERTALYEAGARHGVSLDQALQLAPDPGHRPWWQLEDRGRRDGIIGDIRDRFYAGLPNRRSATLIAHTVRRYETTAWTRDRVWRNAPARYTGKIEALLFDLLKLGPSPSARTVERVLARQQLTPFGGAPGLASSAEVVPNALVDEAQACANAGSGRVSDRATLG